MAKDGTPFFFKSRIELRGSESDYVRECLADARKHLVEAQRRHYDFNMIWDLRNGLTLYVVVLQEVLASRAIRYFAPLKPSVCMAAYLGHGRMLDVLRRSGVPVETMVWDTLNVLTSAILGRHLALVKKLMAKSPALRNSINPWYGDAASFCAGFGSVGILRYLRSEGFDLCKLHRHPKQPDDDERHCGSALLFAVQNRRRDIATDLVAQGEFCEWRNLCDLPSGLMPLSFLTEAVKNEMFDVAKIYVENGWHEAIQTDDEMWQLIDASWADWNLPAFRFLEKVFPQFDLKRILRDGHVGRASRSVKRYCGIMCSRRIDDRTSKVKRSSVEGHCDDVRHWAKMNKPEMVRYKLDEVPEILPLVWNELSEKIVAAFSSAESDAEPCHPYLLRYAEANGCFLFADDVTRLFWEAKCDEATLPIKPLTMEEEFPFDDGLGDYLLPKELHEKYYRTLHARGRAANALLDDPEVDPNTTTRWNGSFADSLIDYVDWSTYKKWLLRGMEIYRDDMDNLASSPTSASRSILPHLLLDLEHRPWVAGNFNGNILVHAAEYGDLKAVKAILDAGCPVNFDRSLGHPSVSPLRAALMNGHYAIARFLYSRGGMNLYDGIALPLPKWIARSRTERVPKINCRPSKHEATNDSGNRPWTRTDSQAPFPR